MNTRYFIAIYVAAATAIQAGAPAIGDDGRLEPALRIVAEAVEAGKIPGAAVFITQAGQPLTSRAFGTCDLATNRKFLPDTICWIASLTKPVTATAAMLLVDEGRLSLDDSVEKYIPSFRAQSDANGRHFPITIRQLMCHTSGIQSSVPLRPPFFFEQAWYQRSLADVAEAIATTQLQFEPGQRVQYSNAAPYVLGHIIELQAGQPFGDFVRERILIPLGMTDTDFAIPPQKIHRASVVYRRENNVPGVYCRFDPNWEVRMTMPDGGLFSTTHDIARFAESFLNRQKPLLSEKSIHLMLNEQAEGYGLGWILDTPGQFSHWGSSGTRVWADQASQVVGVVFFQIQDQQRVDAIQQQFRTAVTAALKGPKAPQSP